jgi:cytochrome d ubiquinol oxidase subunit I
VPTALAGIFGAMSVIAVKSWMNQPGGFTQRGGVITSVNVWQVYFNHAAVYEMPHMILAAYMATGFTVAGVYAAGILHGRRDRYHYTGFALGFVPAAVLTPFRPSWAWRIRRACRAQGRVHLSAPPRCATRRR